MGLRSGVLTEFDITYQIEAQLPEIPTTEIPGKEADQLPEVPTHTPKEKGINNKYRMSIINYRFSGKS